MSLFNKLFGSSKHGKMNESDPGPMPTRGLTLQYEVVAANGVNFAEQFVAAAANINKVNLDYSVTSLEFIDYFFHNMRKEGVKVNDIAETIFAAGCYVGEVMIRNADGHWTNFGEITGLPEDITMMPIVVTLGNGNRADPIAKAFKRFYDGETDSIVYFYSVFTAPKTAGDVPMD